MASLASGSNWARRRVPVSVGHMVSLSPLTTRTGCSTLARPAGEVFCSQAASAVNWAPIGLVGDRGVAVVGGALVQAAEEGVRGVLAGPRGFEEQEVLGVLALLGRLLSGPLEGGAGGCGTSGAGGRGGGQDDPADAVGVLLGDDLGDDAAQGVAEQVDRVQAEGVQEGDGVGGHRLEGVGGGPAGAADAAQVDQDDAPLGREAVDHGGVPVVQHRGDVVQEYQRNALGRADLAVGERGPGDVHGLGDGILAG